eukprot:COSAG06_NODE_28176_length_579_cov_0.745833_1_plen_51_part_10
MRGGYSSKTLKKMRDALRKVLELVKQLCTDPVPELRRCALPQTFRFVSCRV